MKMEHAKRLVILRDYILNEVSDNQFDLGHYMRDGIG